jgi:hypothetical protein
MYRVIGCVKYWRGDGPTVGSSMTTKYMNYLRDGSYTILLQLKGVDDLRNDPDVEVGIYNSAQKAMVNTAGQFLAHQTFRITSNPRWRHTTRGKIVDGVLVTDPIGTMFMDHLLPVGGVWGAVNEWEWHDAKFRLALLPDGGLKGVMGAYLPIEDTVAHARNGGPGVASTANRNCVAEYKTMVALADGYPDPQTGQCTMISHAYEVEGIPAFILPPDTSVVATTN